MKEDKKDHLDKFIVDHQQDFNLDSPKRELWPEIDKRIIQAYKPWYSQEVWLWRAASLILLAVSLFLYQGSSDANQQNAIAVIDAHEFDEVENFYVAQISEKRIQISDIQKNKIELDASYEVDLQRLDAMYEVLKEELEHNPSKEVKDALTLNLLIRINLLNSQLEEIEDVDSSTVEEQAT